MDEFSELLKKAEDYFLGFSGKPGFNPFFKLQELILIRKMNEAGNKDKALGLLKAIKLEPPVTTVKPLTIIPAPIPPQAPSPDSVEQAQEATQKTGVDIQTPKPIEPPKKSMSAKK